MIASYDSQRDFILYLFSDEIKRLEKEILKGIYVKLPKAKNQGEVVLSLNNSKAKSGADVENNNGVYEVFLAPQFYPDLIANGATGTRYGAWGSKVTVVDMESRRGMQDEIIVENLKFYIENRGKLPSIYE